ncbi:hypothetical protein [Riemerella columbina]|uniref:hypothetical protein n=1 Tax=Riemerella columbina TaxID=103810 RepID=UPI00037E7053|nr:hypothetical protein [Riemerella columbina]
MDTAALKLNLINKITEIKEARLIEDLQYWLEFETNSQVYTLTDEQYQAIIKAQKDNTLSEDEANNAIEQWLKEK